MDPTTFSTYFRGQKFFKQTCSRNYGTLSVVQRNGYFAHQEYALIAMLGNDNENVRNIGVAKHRKQITEESANNDDCH